jgi:hypothetical protein
MANSWPNHVRIGSFLSDVDEPGNFRLTTNVEGWGSPARRLTTNARTGNGSWMSGREWAERTIVHSGLIEQATPADAEAVANQLAAFDTGTEYDYVVDKDGVGEIACRAMVAVGPNPEWIDESSFTYGLTLVAGDPFKRAMTATTVTVGAGATVSHTAAGTYVAEIEVTCTTTGTVDLTIAGLRLRTSSLNAGVKLTSGPGFTNPKRTIISSTGVNLFGLIVQPMQWPAISPGVNSIHQAGSADLSIRYFPTYA